MPNFDRYVEIIIVIMSRILFVFCLSIASTVKAQENVPFFQESFFLVSVEGNNEISGMCAQSFGRPLINSGFFIERSSEETEEMISSCLENNLNSNFIRECELVIAQQQVDYIIFTNVKEIDGSLILEISVVEPLLNARIWSEDILITTPTPSLFAREHCAILGESFLMSRRSAFEEVIEPVLEQQEENEHSESIILEHDEMEEIDRFPSRVHISLTNGAHRFRVSITDSNGIAHQCRRRVTNNRNCELSVLEGSSMMNFHAGRHQQMEQISLFAPTTHLNIQYINQDRQNIRIFGGIAMTLGFFGTMASFTTIDGDGFGVFFPLSLTSMLIGEVLIGWGFLGRHNYRIETFH